MEERRAIIRAVISTLNRLSVGDLIHVYKIVCAYADRAKKGV